MRRIEDMTDQEIYDLADEQVERMVTMRCAEEGVRFVDEPPVMETCDYKPITPSGFFYYLKELGIAVFDQGDAIKIAEFLSGFDLYKTRYDFTISKNELHDRLGMIDIEHVPMFDTRDKEVCKSIKEENDRLRKEYEDRLDRYKKDVDRMNEIHSGIWGKVFGVRRKIDRMNNLKAVFVREYLPLVDHDTDKAMVFFKKAYDVDDDTEVYIRKGIKEYPLFNNNID